jgi:hypothetical protein
MSGQWIGVGNEAEEMDTAPEGRSQRPEEKQIPLPLHGIGAMGAGLVAQSCPLVRDHSAVCSIKIESYRTALC